MTDDGLVITADREAEKGRTGGHTFYWGPRDIFVVPSWMTVRHTATRDAFLFSYSDRVVQEKLDLSRQEQL